MKFAESTIIENFITEAKALSALLVPTDVTRIVECFFAGSADFLAMVKTKEHPVALLVKNIKGDMIFAGVVEFNENEDGEGQSNWNFYYTFDPKDIEGKIKYDLSDIQVSGVIAKRSYETYKMKYPQERFITDYAIILGSLLRENLETNAKTGEKFVIEHEGYFKAESEVENGIVIKSLLPDGATKRLIKNDNTHNM